MKDVVKSRMTVLAQIILLSATGSAFADNKATVSATQTLEYASVSELAEQMERNELTSVTLVEYLQARIDTLDQQGPMINAIIELNPQAIDGGHET